MRALAALTLCVSLAAPGFAGAWDTTRNEGISAFQANRFDEAAEHLRAAIPLSQTKSELAIAQYELGVALHGAARPREAIVPLKEALNIWESDAKDPTAAAHATETIAACERNMGDYARATRSLRNALRTAPEGEARHVLLCALGDLEREQGNAGEALHLFQQVAAAKDVKWQRRFDSLTGMADVHRESNAWDAAFAEWNEAAQIGREHRQPTLEGVALRGLGETWLAKGDLARAEPILRKALNIFEGDSSAALQAGSALTSLSQLYAQEDRLAMADDGLQRALQLLSKSLDEHHPQIGVLFRYLADVESRRGDFATAQAHMEQALAIMTATFGPDSPVTATVIASRAAIFQRSGRNEKAVQDYRTALAILQTAGSRATAVRAQILNSYAAVLKASHRKAEANAVMAEARSFDALNVGMQGR